MFDIFKTLIDSLVKNGILPEWVANEIIIILTLTIFLFFIGKNVWNIIRRYFVNRNLKKIGEDLHPYYTFEDVKRATQYYIPTKFQTSSPSEDDEPGQQFLAIPKADLLKFFLKTAFPAKGDANRFYIILADSGMGKTTFMINLFLRYKNQKKWFWSMPKYDIRLLPLGSSETLNEIDKIENKKNTILLLDAFDEDIEALSDYKQRMNFIVEKVKHFREVVITCRTQFFPSKEEEPFTTKVFTFGGETLDSQIKFQRSYISVFDDKDIIRYVKKRFSIFRFKTRNEAFEITKNCPNLLVRPMLLSHIEELINSKKQFYYTYQIYDVLIEKWIQRESNKPGIVERYGSTERYGEILSNFSEKLALHLYQNRDKYQGYGIKYDVKIEDIVELQLSDIEFEYKELGREIKSKSLLNRNGEGFYKFAHKSILELFLARVLFHRSDLLEMFDFKGMDMALLFHHEMTVEYIRTLHGSFTSQIYRNEYIADTNVKKSWIFPKNAKRYIFNIVSFIYKFYYISLLEKLILPKGASTFSSNSLNSIEYKSEKLDTFSAKLEFSLVISNCSQINPITLINFKKAKSIILADLINYSLLYEILDILFILGLNVQEKYRRDEVINWLSEKLVQYKYVEFNSYLKSKIDNNYFSDKLSYLNSEKDFKEDFFLSNRSKYEDIVFSNIQLDRMEKFLPNIIPYLSFNKKISAKSIFTDNHTLTLFKYKIYLREKNKDLLFEKIDSSDLSLYTDIYQMNNIFFSAEIINKFQEINEFIKNTQKLQEKLPSCKVEF